MYVAAAWIDKQFVFYREYTLENWDSSKIIVPLLADRYPHDATEAIMFLESHKRENNKIIIYA